MIKKRIYHGEPGYNDIPGEPVIEDGTGMQYKVVELEKGLQGEPGPTGQYPEGKMNADDDGELRIAVGEEDGRVKIVFGKKISWLAMTPDQAIAMGEVLIARAEMIKADGGSKH